MPSDEHVQRDADGKGLVVAVSEDPELPRHMERSSVEARKRILRVDESLAALRDSRLTPEGRENIQVRIQIDLAKAMHHTLDSFATQIEKSSAQADATARIVARWTKVMTWAVIAQVIVAIVQIVVALLAGDSRGPA